MGTIGADCSWVARVMTPQAPTSATWLGEAGAGSIDIPTFLGLGVRACAQVP